MKKIKEIYCIGSSFTAGGGFEFESERNSEQIKNFYSLLTDEEFTQFNFSYPGQLQKLLGNNIRVINKAKQGSGNQRTERIIYDIVNSKNFIKDENLFIIEFTALGRDELYSNKFDKHFVLNYVINSENQFKFVGSAFDYFYQTESEKTHIESFDNFFEEYIKNFKGIQTEISKKNKETEFFINYLEYNSINYLVSSPDVSFNDKNIYSNEKNIEFGDGTYFKKDNSFVDFSFQNKMMIKNETNELSLDMHSGFKANKIIAHVIYNKLIELGFTDLPTIKIDWKKLKNTEFYNL